MIETPKGPENLNEEDIQEMRTTLEGIVNGSQEIILGETTHTLKFWKGEMKKLPQDKHQEFLELFENARKTLHVALDRQIDS